jgi:hypothetical protein
MMRSPFHPALLLALLAGGCSDQSDQRSETQNRESVAPAAVSPGPAPAATNETLPTTNATEPGPVEASLAEPKTSPTSAQGAATVVETYYALIEAGKYREALALRENADSMTAAKFAAGFAKYGEYHATVGAPSEIQGAAGSLYVEVPVQLYGRMKDGKPFGSAGTITLRRANDVPGATAAQRRWRIYGN